MAKLSLMARLGLDISNYQANMQKARNNSDLIGQGMKRLGGMIAGAFSIGVITNFAKASFEAYQQQMEAEARLQDAFKGRQDIMKRLAEDAGILQNTTLFADDDIINAQALFATMGLGEDAIRKLTPLVIDLAARYGKELPEAVDMVKSALNGSGKAWKQYGFEIEGAVGSGDRFNSIIDQLNTKVGGQAEALGKLDINAPKRLAVAWDEFSEMMGGLIAGPLARVLDYFTKDLPAAFEYIGNGFQVIKQGKDTIDAIAEGMNDYARADETTRKSMVDGWKEMLGVFEQNYKQALLTEGTNSRNAKYYQKQISDLSTLITKVDEYTASQSNAVRVDEEAIEAANKLAEARLKASQAKDRDFITAVGYKDRSPKADFGKNITNDAVITQLDETLRVMRDIPNIQERITLSNDELIESLKVAEPSFQRFIVNLKTWKDKSEEVVKQMNEMLSIGIADMIGTISEGLANAAIEGSFRSFFLTIIDAIASFMQAFGKAIIAYAVAMDAFKKTFTNPWVAIGAGAALIATAAIIKGLVARQQQGLTEMAAGGIVTGPTPVLVGEYPGARSNPEVIAPLDKLKGMLGGGDTVNVRGRLSGSDILISSERYDKLRTRLRGF